MITLEEPAHNKVFNEDIVLAGENIISSACTVYSITITNDSAVAGVVNLSDSTSYDNAEKFEKVMIGASETKQLIYPKGLPLDNGLSAAANVGSVDISATYD